MFSESIIFPIHEYLGWKVFLRYAIIALWLFVLYTSSIGLSQCFKGLFSKINPEEQVYWIIVRLSLGLAIHSIFITLLLFFGIYHSLIVCLWYLFWSIHGLWYSKVLFLLIQKILNFIKTGAWGEKTLFLMFIVIILFLFMSMCGFPQGQESYQYHLYLPKLFNDQKTLFLDGFVLYSEMLNFWGIEAMMTFPERLGGVHLVMVSYWYNFILFCLQIVLFCRIFSKNVFFYFLTILLVCFSTKYINLAWTLKPEILLSGYSALLLFLIHKNNKVFMINKQYPVIIGILLSFLISIKVTSLSFLPFAVCYFFVYHRTKLLKFLKISIFFLILFLPWYLLFYDQANGQSIVERPSGFIVSKTNTITNTDANLKYLQSFWKYLKGFSPLNYILIFALPWFFYLFRRHTLVCLMFIYSFILSYLLNQGGVVFGDQFRYVSFFHFVYPVIVACFLVYLCRYKYFKVIVIAFLVLFAIKRSYTMYVLNDKYIHKYLAGQTSFKSLQGMNGIHQYDYYKNNKKKGERLLYIGHANYVIDDQDAIRVRSWGSEYPIDKMNGQEFLNFLEKNKIQWILYEKGKYTSFGRGFGGKEYVNSDASLYYRNVHKRLGPYLKVEKEISSWSHSLIYLKDLSK